MRMGYLQIADQLEEKILSGKLKPNEPLASTKILAKEMNVALLTMQRGLKRLQYKGLIRRIPQKGTFVSSNLRGDAIGLMLGKDPFQCASPHYRLLVRSFSDLSINYGFNIKPYFDLRSDDHYYPVRQATEDIAGGLLRCMVVCGCTVEQLHWLRTGCACPWIYVPGFDAGDAAYKGVTHLLKAGRRRIKVLSLYSHAPYPKDLPGAENERSSVAKAFQTAGLEMPEDTLVYCGQEVDSGYQYVNKLLSSETPRPDALLVNHDVIVNGVLFALLESGLKIPDDLAVVAHENKGAEHFSPVPLSVLSTDSDQVATLVLEHIKAANLKLLPGENRIGAQGKATLIVRTSSAPSKHSARKPLPRHQTKIVATHII